MSVVLLALLLCSASRASDAEFPDFAEAATIRIDVIGVLTDYYSRLDESDLEEELSTSGSHVPLAIEYKAVVKRFLVRCFGREYKRVPRRNSVDLRLKVAVTDTNNSTITMYSDRFGNVILDGNQFEAVDGWNWLAALDAWMRDLVLPIPPEGAQRE